MPAKKTVDDYLIDVSHWQAELLDLRRILLSTELKETIKWGMPCYTHNGQNIVGMGGFKSYFGLWFHQGVFLSDSAKILINAQTGKTKALSTLFALHNNVTLRIILRARSKTQQNKDALKK